MRALPTRVLHCGAGFPTCPCFHVHSSGLAGWKTCPTGSPHRYTIALAFRLHGSYAHLRRHWKAIRPFAGAIMTIQAIRTGFFAAVLLLVTPLAADSLPTPSPGAPVEEDAGTALARQAQIVIDAILEHHVDPPTRQEMWLAGARAVLAKAGVVQHPGLSAEISGLTAPDDFVMFAKRLCVNDDVRLKSRAALREAFIEG